MENKEVPKHRVVHCIAHLDYLTEVIVNEYPDKNLIFKAIKLSRDYIETVMKQRTNCKPLIDAVLKQAVELKKALKADKSDVKKVSSMIVNRLTAISKRWGKLDEPVITYDENTAVPDDESEEMSDEAEEQEQ